jgi:hypothetical protein
LWGETDGKKVTVNRLGKGRVVWGQPLGKILAEQLPAPQFVGCDKTVTHIRRQTGDAEIWFVASANDKPVSGDCVFRTTMGQPELWDAMTGQTRALATWRQEEGRVVIPMRFEPRQSWFVVFQKPLVGTDRRAVRSESGAPGGRALPNFPELKPVMELTGSWDVQFDPKWFYPDNDTGGKVRFERLEDWTKRPEEAVRYFSGTAVYRKTFEWSGTGILPVSASAKRSTPKMAVPLFLELGEFKGIAEVHLNGRNLGTVWCAPWQVDITDALKPGQNALEIRMANCWPNRLIGDEKLPADAEYVVNGVGGGMLKSWPKWLLDKNTPRTSGRRTFSTYKHWTGTEPLQSSGLLGPARVMMAE